jgi:zinc transporter ZupT
MRSSRCAAALAAAVCVFAASAHVAGGGVHSHDHHAGHSHGHEGHDHAAHDHAAHDHAAHDHAAHNHAAHDHAAHNHAAHDHDHDGHDHAAHDHAVHAHAGSHDAHAAHADAAHAPRQQFPRTALILTTLSGAAAALGGVIVVAFGAPSPRLLAHLLSFAAGIMLYVSYADLLPHAVSDLGEGADAGAHDHAHHDASDGHAGHVHGPGLFIANVWMLGGMFFFALAALFVPDGGDGGGHGHAHGAAEPAPAALPAPPAVPAAPASAGKARMRRGSVVTAGAIVEKVGGVRGKRAAASKAAASETPASRRMFMTGLIAALGITLHNLPEGLIVYNQALYGVCDTNAAPAAAGTLSAFLGLPADLSKCMSRGVAVAVAIALHNIPEGMAVASPIFAATGSAWQALYWTGLSAAAEPLAAVVFGLCFSHLLTPALMSKLNAAVAGVMIALCLGELVPAAASMAPPKVRRDVRHDACMMLVIRLPRPPSTPARPPARRRLSSATCSARPSCFCRCTRCGRQACTEHITIY